MEVYEFHELTAEGYGPDRSAFLSAFCISFNARSHVTAGLIWIVIMMIQASRRFNKLTVLLKLLGLFWHFLDVVWICVFTVVYLMGAM